MMGYWIFVFVLFSFHSIHCGYVDRHYETEPVDCDG